MKLQKCHILAFLGQKKQGTTIRFYRWYVFCIYKDNTLLDEPMLC